MSNKKILFIDDESACLNFIENVMGEFALSFDMEFQSDPLKGIELCKTKKFDLISTDIKMPKVTVKEVLAAIRGSEANNTTPVMVLSANVNVRTSEELSEFDNISYFHKPINTTEFKAFIKKLLQ